MVSDQLMRDTVTTLYTAAVNGTLNSAFSITIPDGYAMELDKVDFFFSAGAVPLDNRGKYFLVDDPDEDADPGHSAEKVIQSTEIQHDGDAGTIWSSITLDCHKTLIVKNPNFISVLDNVPGGNFNMYARIWFDFIKVSKDDAYDLLRQQQY
ncbi:unnamed protein product [marine sediment metagenome]|uniref:Uncharacterized protein n=1 Tax=marine sediment metagenome TaxID=412755 RepID=X1D8P9_9ZZZZ